MDPKRLKEAFQQLEALDERLTHKVRPRSQTSMISPSIEQVEERMKDLSRYTLELKDILREVILSFAAKRKPPG